MKSIQEVRAENREEFKKEMIVLFSTVCEKNRDKMSLALCESCLKHAEGYVNSLSQAESKLLEAVVEFVSKADSPFKKNGDDYINRSDLKAYLVEGIVYPQAKK